jgi:hypothetical protein
MFGEGRPLNADGYAWRLVDIMAVTGGNLASAVVSTTNPSLDSSLGGSMAAGAKQW